VLSLARQGGKEETTVGTTETYLIHRQKNPVSMEERGSVVDPAIAKAAPRTVEEIQQRLEEELNGEDPEEETDGEMPDVGGGEARGSGKGRGKKKSTNGKKWGTNSTPPALSAGISYPVVWLSYFTTSPDLQNKLVNLLATLSTPPSESSSPSPMLPSDLVSLACQCVELENAEVVTDFCQMLSYMHLALHIQ
jgi:hypothetical protein